MKRLITTNSIICFVLLAAFGLVSCDNNSTTAPDPISTEDYPTATFSTDFEGNTVAEGDTIMYKVAVDKPLDSPVDLELSVSSPDSLTESDYEYSAVTIPAYSKDTVMVPIVFPNDGIPEKETKEITFTLEDQDLGSKYRLNPDTEFPTKTVTLENYNDPNSLTVVLSWKNADTDIDMWLNMVDDGTYASQGFDGDGDGLVLWGSAATGDNPEVMKIPANDVNANGGTGEYYVEFDPYSVDGNTVDYMYRVGYPDQTVEYYEGTFDTQNLSSYTADNLDYYYDGSVVWTVYRMLEVDLTAGGEFTVTDAN